MNDTILLIDDSDDKREILLSCLTKEFAGTDVTISAISKDNVDDFLPAKDDTGENGPETNAPEDRFYFYLISNPRVKLVVVDHDLSMLDSNLSESVVATACQNAGVPHCRYSRSTTHQTTRQKLNELVEQSHVYSVKIDITDIEVAEFGDNPESPQKIKSIYEGFQSLELSLEKFDPEQLKNGPAQLLSEMLGFPGLSTVFHQYATAYSVFSEIIKIHQIIEEDSDQKTEFADIIRRRLNYILGFWLHNVILRYPGIIINEIAAASYLNLSTEDFLTYSQKFSDAKYEGPFSTTTETTYWWRYKLDDILIDSDCEDGIEFLGKADIENIKPSICYVSGGSPAGYYCLFEKKPISEEVSIGSLDWMPRGADLSRVNRDKYDEVAPLAGF